MSIESDLNRLANAAEGILAHLTGVAVEKPKPGRPSRKAADTTVDPAPQDAPVTTGALSDAKAAAEMPVVAGPTLTAPAVVPATVASAAAGVTIEQLQKLVGEKVGLGKREGVLTLIAATGADRASKVPADKLDGVYAAISAL